jgi:putative Ca2+/H+ antiporter (TMEM165/GDT1 family)
VIGTTGGVLAANLPVVLLGHAFAKKLPMRAIHIGASVLFIALGFLFLVRAFAGATG